MWRGEIVYFSSVRNTFVVFSAAYPRRRCQRKLCADSSRNHGAITGLEFRQWSVTPHEIISRYSGRAKPWHWYEAPSASINMKSFKTTTVTLLLLWKRTFILTTFFTFYEFLRIFWRWCSCQTMHARIIAFKNTVVKNRSAYLGAWVLALLTLCGRNHETGNRGKRRHCSGRAGRWTRALN